MFGFLKKKLKETVGKFSKKVEEEAEVIEEAREAPQPEPVEKEKKPKEPIEKPLPKEEPKKAPEAEKEKTVEKKPEPAPKTKEIPTEEPSKEKQPEPPKEEAPEKEPLPEEHKEEKKESKGFFKKIFHKKEEAPEQEEKQPERKGFLSKVSESVTKVQLSEKKFDELFWDLEVALLENNVAVEVVEKIKADLRQALTQDKISRKGIDKTIQDSLKKSISGLFAVPGFDLLEKVKTKKPHVICMIGVNGSGKTTTLAKLIQLFQKNGLKVVVAASDTFRAAAIQQLEEHTTKLGAKLIKHDYESDPAAVAFDAVEHAKAKGADVVLIDTAGRLHSNQNLMDELKKVIRVNNPDLKIFIGESTTGNDCVEQATYFNDAVGIDAIILSKADVDEKGGASISVSFVTKKPILYIGTGQSYDDLKPFDAAFMIKNLGL